MRLICARYAPDARPKRARTPRSRAALHCNHPPDTRAAARHSTGRPHWSSADTEAGGGLPSRAPCSTQVDPQNIEAAPQ